MNIQNTTKQAPIPADRLAEAGVWIARLHGDDRNHALECGFRQWLRAHPLNARAFELTTEVWEDSHNLRRVVPFAHDVPRAPPRQFWFPFPAKALAGALAILATVIITASILYFQREGVATGVGEQRLLALEDGTRVFLNTATRVVVHYDKDTRRVELKYGEALFDVARRPNRPFLVQAGDRQVTALGTSFVVRHDSNRTSVTLVDGKVEVVPIRPAGDPKNADTSGRPGGVNGNGISNESSAASTRAYTQPAEHANKTHQDAVGPAEVFTLTPGQRLTIAENKPAELDTPSLDGVIAWRRGQVILDDTPLSSAITEMNRYNAVKLTIEQPEAADVIVNGLFQAGDSMSFANAVAQTYGLRVVERRNEIALLGLPQAAARTDR